MFVFYSLEKLQAQFDPTLLTHIFERAYLTIPVFTPGARLLTFASCLTYSSCRFRPADCNPASVYPLPLVLLEGSTFIKRVFHSLMLAGLNVCAPKVCVQQCWCLWMCQWSWWWQPAGELPRGTRPAQLIPAAAQATLRPQWIVPLLDSSGQLLSSLPRFR